MAIVQFHWREIFTNKDKSRWFAESRKKMFIKKLGKLISGEFSIHHSWDLASESNPECLGALVGKIRVD